MVFGVGIARMHWLKTVGAVDCLRFLIVEFGGALALSSIIEE